MSVAQLLKRDSHGVFHIVALSGGHDSTALAALLFENEPRPYNLICTPTSDELPPMFAHWRSLSERFGTPVIPVTNGTLKSICEKEKMLPNFRVRFCTRIAKIEPYRELLFALAAIGPVVSYVGLRADEPGRAGGAYDDIPGVSMRFPLREWQMDENAVQATLSRFGIVCPIRTDCARCYHQRIGEWWELWAYYPDIFDDAVADETKFGHTYRTPGRDSWPTALADLKKAFEAGKVPEKSLDRMFRERMQAGSCRVCSL